MAEFKDGGIRRNPVHPKGKSGIESRYKLREMITDTNFGFKSEGKQNFELKPPDLHSTIIEWILYRGCCKIDPAKRELRMMQMLHDGFCEVMGEIGETETDKYLSVCIKVLLSNSVFHLSDVDFLKDEAMFKLNDSIIHPNVVTPLRDIIFLLNIRYLDLSETKIKELPKVIRNLVDLEYLDISRTRVKFLPDSVYSLHKLKTLLLLNCRELVVLPEGMKSLSNLQHFGVDVASLLISMPLSLGELTKLETLPAFVVGKENGCRIVELKNLANLRGTLRILRLENVSNSEEAKEAALDKKQHLQKLELQWTESDNTCEVLEHLQPSTSLKELQIVGYGGTKFPIWIGNPLFSILVTITIHYCPNSEILPVLGRLPLLKSLCISEMHAVKIIDPKFCGRIMPTENLDMEDLQHEAISQKVIERSKFTAFPMLENLKLNGFLELESWTGLEEGDFPVLHKMNISDCPKLTALPELSLLKSLRFLAISVCSVLQSLPKKGLPASLENLLITDCSLLKESLLKSPLYMRSPFYMPSAHSQIPNIWIDHQQISEVKNADR